MAVRIQRYKKKSCSSVVKEWRYKSQSHIFDPSGLQILRNKYIG